MHPSILTNSYSSSTDFFPYGLRCFLKFLFLFYRADKRGLFPAWIKPAVSVIVYRRQPSLIFFYIQDTEPPPLLVYKVGISSSFNFLYSTLFLSGVKALII